MLLTNTLSVGGFHKKKPSQSGEYMLTIFKYILQPVFIKLFNPRGYEYMSIYLAIRLVLEKWDS